MSVITFAHRGARAEEPENTLAAFRRALDQGASGLETDAWLSADGEVVLCHDDTVRRGLRRLHVDRSTADELARFADVPRLADLYETLGTGFELSVDLKTARAAKPMMEVARRFGAAERLWLCTPDLDRAVALAAEPDVRSVHSTFKGYIETPMERHAALLGESGVAALNLHRTEWTAGLVALFHRFDVRAFAWDTQEERHITAMLRLGIDALYCDRPKRLVEVVAGWNGGDGG